MQEKIFNVKNYWRNIDKQILVSFSILFILGVFFSFSSTSFLADERLNKSYYFFFQKHLIDKKPQKQISHLAPINLILLESFLSDYQSEQKHYLQL